MWTRLGAIETRGDEVVVWRYEYDALQRLTAEKRDTDGVFDPNADTGWERHVTYTYREDVSRTSVTDEVLGGERKEYIYEADSQQLKQIEIAELR